MTAARKFTDDEIRAIAREELQKCLANYGAVFGNRIDANAHRCEPDPSGNEKICECGLRINDTHPKGNF